MNPWIQHAGSLATVAIILALVTGGCASTGDAETPLGPDGKPIDRLGPDEPVPWNPEITADDRAAGKVLSDISRKIDTWNRVVLAPGDSENARRTELLEDAIKNDVRRHLQTVIDQLETGPVINRRIAACALGFSDVPNTLGPLLAALDDSDDTVVANALLGLSVLKSSRTPLPPLVERFMDQEASLPTRNNAGQALRALPLDAASPEDREAVIEASRLALGDEERALRLHGAMLLALVADADSIGRLGNALMDEAPIVGQASSVALARIGTVDASAKGSAARALVAGLAEVDNKVVKSEILASLQLLGGRNYGDDEDAWAKWARSMP